ncbi:MAG TPA: hypothetical protein VES36_01770, partial [Candidatus Limnocylindrales bacterium]|nr:hypothetical protein [Candidatus Limnocylindrales bacterium]
ADALREGGRTDLADKLEAKELAGRLRKTGREDLADALEAGDPPGAGEKEPHERQPERTHVTA